MSLIEDELGRYVDQNIVVVMSDGKKFRGKLIKYDLKIIVLEEVFELSERLQWVKPIIYTTVAKSMTDQQDVVEQSERGYLNEVIVNTRHIVRIWPWEPKKLD